MKRSAGIMV